MNNIARQSPNLFKRLLQQKELIRLSLNNEKELDIDLSTNNIHLRPAVTSKFKKLEIRRTRHPIYSINLATSLLDTLLVYSSLILDIFRRTLY